MRGQARGRARLLGCGLRSLTVPPMERFTISLDDELAHQFDAWIAEHRYPNRSEAVRDLLRAELERSSPEGEQGTECVASLSYVYNRHELDVAQRLTTLHHDHHDLLIASMQVPLDHEYRLETLALRGDTLAVHRFADLLCAQRGVRHGKLNLISVEMHQPHRHAHADAKLETKKRGNAAKPHLHVRPAH
jgi:CopG family transcriptional regulator, nickel-responsive regulator